ncbi:M23 family metallopeptidase [Edaphobacillus lindanitolerans]|uniref:Stage II sporulation protein Q n=1 Tax=Edaphobacillus lindanitolerans TaxID=550447 RepID=A0A1U7PJ79_9BACI|nr:M23 family metallopeptidase [Edaphobacillus lindanitolerans]SIT69458.1 stage II sporulation protein Q [Edaphobacillus lindanitolerans]
MREENKPSTPSQKKKSKRSAWFWPAIYSGFALLFVGMVWTYQAVVKDDQAEQQEVAKSGSGGGEVTIETNAENENMKFPFDEALLDSVKVVQEFYDVEADSEQREKALLVFQQSYVTNSGISLSAGEEPFEVVAALSGTVEDIVVDEFTGNRVTIQHANGLKTTYGSVTGILVEKGDSVGQGDVIATTTSNEWNPEAGNHLHFEVTKDGVAVNPGEYLAF